MRLLVLGGSGFLSHAVAVEALARGHEVTCACRGTTGAVPPTARHAVLDRESDDPATLPGPFEAVVDVARHPSWVRRAVAAWGDAHWVFVSTCNVYRDESEPGGTAEAPLVDPIDTDEDPMSAPEVYGAMKVACENLVRNGARSATIVRPGLIVGPGDPTGRFSYWPRRLAAGGPVLAPPADEPVQLIDVRDLAAWLVTCAERRTTGSFDAVCPPKPRSELLKEVAAGVGARPEFRWTDEATLEEYGVAAWMGDRALPLWVPGDDARGFMARDVTASLAAGLATRPIADTARDTLAWLEAHPDAAVTGLSRADEREVLRALGDA